jgi:transcriptional regulator with XRE-family HTH domain
MARTIANKSCFANIHCGDAQKIFAYRSGMARSKARTKEHKNPKYVRSGALIAAARKAKGYSQAKLAELIGLESRQVLQNWEGGKALGKWEQMTRLAALLDLTLDEIAHGERAVSEVRLTSTAIKAGRILDSLSQQSQSNIIDRLIALSRFENEDRDIAARVLTRADDGRRKNHEKDIEELQELMRKLPTPVSPE